MNFLHAFQPIQIKIEPTDTADTLRSELDWKKNYLLPNTDLDAAAAPANRGKVVQLWLEWFLERHSGLGLEEVDGATRHRSYKLRTEATRLQVFTEDEGSELKAKFKGLYPDFMQIEIVA